MKKLTGIMFVLFLLALPLAVAEEADGDWEIVPGVEGEKALNLTSGILALALFVLTAVAYARTRSRRLLFVAAAFLLFAVKGGITSMELFFGEWAWVDPVSAVLDFFILLSFFVGLLRK